MNRLAEAISAQRLAEAVIYDPEVGVFVWRERPDDHFDHPDRAAKWNGKYPGKPAFTSADSRGYFRGMLDQRMLYAHRAAIAIHTGRWPEGEVDHINRNKSDNRLINLRVVSHRENRMNTDQCDEVQARRAAMPEIRPPLVPGVRRQGMNTWAVRIKRLGKETHIGTFPCFGQAVKARMLARGRMVQWT